MKSFCFPRGKFAALKSCLPFCLSTGSFRLISLLFATVVLNWGFTNLPEQDCRFQHLLPFQVGAQRQKNMWSFENMFSFTWKLLWKEKAPFYAGRGLLALLAEMLPPYF